MHVIWHYDCGVEVVAFAVIMQTVLEDGVSGFRRKWDSIAFAECTEYCPS
jgi:hypothetical protein